MGGVGGIDVGEEMGKDMPNSVEFVSVVPGAHGVHEGYLFCGDVGAYV